MRFFLIAVVVLSTCFCSKADEVEAILRLFKNINKSISNLNSLNISSICQNMLGENANKKEIDDCVNYYQPLINKKTIRIDYFLGYSNTGNLVNDGFDKTAIMSLLSSSCSNSKTPICGFTNSPDDSDVFYKEISWAGQMKRFEIHLYSSSVSPDDDVNRKSEAQKIKTAQTQKKFIEAVASTDILIYFGHSRFGGGPDFGPEKLTSKGDDDVNYYKKNQPGVKDLVKGLTERSSKNSLFLMVLASCDSKKHFSKILKKSRNGPVNTLLATRSVLPDEALISTMNTISMLLSGNCPIKYQESVLGFSYDNIH